MLKRVVDRSREQKTEIIKLKSRIMLKEMKIVSPRGRTSSPGANVISVIPDTEENYNGLNFHMKMSGRKLAVIRRRAEKLRQRDREIRARLERVNSNKVIKDRSTAKQNTTVSHDGNSTSIFNAGNGNSLQPDLFPDNISTNNFDVASTGNIASMVQNKTGSVDHENQGNLNLVCDSISPDDYHLETGSDVSTDTDQENEEGRQVISYKEKKQSRTSVITLKAFVGERYSLNRAKIPQCSNCIKRIEDVLTPERNRQEVYSLRETISFAELVSPMNLGVSPMRINKTTKKTRMDSTLTSHLARRINFSKKRISKRIQNLLKKD